MKKFFIFFALALFLVIPLSASKAFEVKVDNSVKLNKEEIADGNVYASCGDMTIDGTVNGDVIAVCKTITINGTVNGDLIAFSNSVTVNGEIKGSARIAGSNLTINGTVDHNINAFGTEINLGPNSLVNWDVLIAGVNGNFAGNINGNLHGYITTATISGKIGKNINLQINDERTAPGQGGLLITKDAVIGGGLTYSAKQELKLESQSSIVGPILRQPVKTAPNNPMNILTKIFYIAASLILIGLVLVTLKNKSVIEINKTLEDSWWQSLLIGLAALILAPIIILLFIFTIIGIPLSLIILAVYFICLVLAMIFPAIFIGDFLLKKSFKKPANVFASLVLGLIISTLIVSLPYIGWLLSFLLLIWGLGGLLITIKNTQHD